MSGKIVYKTKQREELLEYLSMIPGKHITVNDICNHFKREGRNIATATVYRQLEKMVDEGIVKKYIIDANSPACFEYSPEEEECGPEVCFHCKCEECGRLIHLHCEELEEIKEHLMADHGFFINPLRTVFYGLCEQCVSKVDNK